MAIPFAIPEEDEDNNISNPVATVILVLSQTRIGHVVEDGHNEEELQECMEDLVKLLTDEVQRRFNQLCVRRLEVPQVGQPSRRVRSNTESDCDAKDGKVPISRDHKDLTFDPDKGKINTERTGTIDKEEAPRHLNLRGGDNAGEKRVEDNLFSRLVPKVRTFWTAVPLICMVGLHLLQSSYCMQI